MRIGLWSLAHLHGYSYLASLAAMEGLTFVGLADEDPERGRRAAEERGVPFVEDPDDLLDAVEAVVITSANANHRAMALRAAEKGVSVLLEKPIATTAEDGRAIVDAFASRGLTLATAFPCPFSPAFEELVARVHRGELGRLLAVRATNRGTMPGGFFIELERSAGGAVIDHTVHVADLLRRLTRAEIRSVYAEIGHGLYHEPWDDSGILTLEMEDGTFATLDCSWSRPKSYPTWGDVTLRVIGERGNATVDLFVQHLELYPGADARPTWLGWGSDLDRLMIADFCDAVTTGRPPRSTGLDGLRALEAALAAYASARTATPVDISAVRR